MFTFITCCYTRIQGVTCNAAAAPGSFCDSGSGIFSPCLLPQFRRDATAQGSAHEAASLIHSILFIERCGS